MSYTIEDARASLSRLQVAEHRKPNVRGLNGWVYEETIRYCLRQELQSQGFSPKIEEQQKLSGRKKVDLLVDGTIAIEIKSRGNFDKPLVFEERYSQYREEAEQKGWIYLYLTGTETHIPYRDLAKNVFGDDRVFFLDRKGEWSRFVKEVARHLLL